MSERPQTFVFADLAGYTAMTEAHGDERAAELAGDFYEAVRALLGQHRAHEVKGLGDAVMLRGEDPALAVGLGMSIVWEMRTRHGYPAVRVGMHSGPAVERGGDWFGSAVNLAARVSSVAGGGEILLTEETQRAAGEPEGVRLRSVGERQFKNVQRPVRLYAAERESEDSTDWCFDPVCRMAVDPQRGAGELSHRGTVYHFCSLECAGRFAADPDAYAGS